VRKCPLRPSPSKKWFVDVTRFFSFHFLTRQRTLITDGDGGRVGGRDRFIKRCHSPPPRFNAVAVARRAPHHRCLHLIVEVIVSDCCRPRRLFHVVVVA
jgi:hypothetical protein